MQRECDQYMVALQYLANPYTPNHNTRDSSYNEVRFRWHKCCWNFEQFQLTIVPTRTTNPIQSNPIQSMCVSCTIIR
jgi:hypothetical protein